MSNGSVSHSSSTMSSHPSASSSGSNSSGMPSPSVSRRMAVIVMSKDFRNRLLEATTVKMVVSTSTPTIPLINPLELLNSSPSGISGEIDHPETLPPKITGVRYISSTCAISSRLSSRYIRSKSVSLESGRLDWRVMSTLLECCELLAQTEKICSWKVVDGTP